MRLAFEVIFSVRYDAQSGRLIVSGRVARVGVQQYPGGAEYRDEREVFDAASMASFEGAPITIGHVAWLDSRNVKGLAVGFVRDVHRDGMHLAGELVIVRADAIEKVRRKELVELSAGYSCDQEHTPGVFKGELYAKSQHRIRANHVALLPRGGARCGSSCSVSV